VNKLVLILFGIVLIATLAVGGFYFYQTQSLSLLRLLPSSYIPIDTATQKAGKDCKNTGYNNNKDADSYLTDFIQKTGANDNHSDGTYLHVISFGNNCWGVWVGDKSLNGTLFWENNQGKINQTKAKVQQL